MKLAKTTLIAAALAGALAALPVTVGATPTTPIAMDGGKDGDQGKEADKDKPKPADKSKDKAKEADKDKPKPADKSKDKAACSGKDGCSGKTK